MSESVETRKKKKRRQPHGSVRQSTQLQGPSQVSTCGVCAREEEQKEVALKRDTQVPPVPLTISLNWFLSYQRSPRAALTLNESDPLSIKAQRSITELGASVSS